MRDVLVTLILSHVHRAGACGVTQHHSSFTDAPLFTKDLALSGDAVAEAAGLDRDL